MINRARNHLFAFFEMTNNKKNSSIILHIQYCDWFIESMQRRRILNPGGKRFYSSFHRARALLCMCGCVANIDVRPAFSFIRNARRKRLCADFTFAAIFGGDESINANDTLVDIGTSCSISSISIFAGAFESFCRILKSESQLSTFKRSRPL